MNKSDKVSSLQSRYVGGRLRRSTRNRSTGNTSAPACGSSSAPASSAHVSSHVSSAPATSDLPAFYFLHPTSVSAVPWTARPICQGAPPPPPPTTGFPREDWEKILEKCGLHEVDIRDNRYGQVTLVATSRW